MLSAFPIRFRAERVATSPPCWDRWEWRLRDPPRASVSPSPKERRGMPGPIKTSLRRREGCDKGTGGLGAGCAVGKQHLEHLSEPLRAAPAPPGGSASPRAAPASGAARDGIPPSATEMRPCSTQNPPGGFIYFILSLFHDLFYLLLPYFVPSFSHCSHFPQAFPQLCAPFSQPPSLLCISLAVFSLSTFTFP